MDFLTRFINKRPKKEYVLSLDVGTRVAKALVSHVDYEDNIVTNLGVGRAEQKTGNMAGGKISDAGGVVSSCSLAIEEAIQMAGVRPKKMLMGLSGNTVKIRTDSFEIERDSPGNRIKTDELKGIIGEIHRRSLEEINGSLTSKEREAGIRLASADIVDFSIDGYRVINPLSFRGRKLKIMISNSYMSEADFGVINGIARELGFSLLKVAYGPYAVIKAIGAENALSFDAVLIDAGGNITDVVLVKGGNIQKAGMFMLGGHLFTKRLANKFDISEKNAEDLKMNYANGRMNEEDRKKIEDILAEDIALWLSGVELIAEEASREFLIPSRILCYGGGIQLPGVAGSLNRLNDAPISFSSKLNLDLVRLEYIVGNIDKTGKLNGLQDITLAGLAHLSLDFADTEDAANVFLTQII